MRVRVAVPSPQVVVHVLHCVHVAHDASTRQQVAPVLRVRVSEDEPGHSEPPHCALQVRVRVVEPVCVTHEAVHDDQPLQTPLTALMQQLDSNWVELPLQVLVHELAGTMQERVLVRVAEPQVLDHAPKDHDDHEGVKGQQVERERMLLPLQPKVAPQYWPQPREDTAEPHVADHEPHPPQAV